MTFVILNLEQATFDCTFGRGCEGICCRNGRPMVFPEDAARIDDQLNAVFPALRPEARAIVEREGYVSRRRKEGHPVLRVLRGWCVVFNRGCVLHRTGAKPQVCAVFPLSRDRGGPWYVRQKGWMGEQWDLPCLDPATTTIRAAESLKAEIALAERLELD